MVTTTSATRSVRLDCNKFARPVLKLDLQIHFNVQKDFTITENLPTKFSEEKSSCEDVDDGVKVTVVLVWQKNNGEQVLDLELHLTVLVGQEDTLQLLEVEAIREIKPDKAEYIKAVNTEGQVVSFPS